MEAVLDRRVMLGGTIALATASAEMVTVPARAATLGERQMRRKLCERLMRRRLAMKAAYRLDDACEEILAGAQHYIARIELMEFDLAEGPWRALAEKYPHGIPQGVVGEARVRDRLEGDVDWATRRAGEEPDSAEAKARQEKASAALAEFERGEGSWWRVVEARPNEL